MSEEFDEFDLDDPSPPSDAPPTGGDTPAPAPVKAKAKTAKPKGKAAAPKKAAPKAKAAQKKAAPHSNGKATPVTAKAAPAKKVAKAAPVHRVSRELIDATNLLKMASDATRIQVIDLLAEEESVNVMDMLKRLHLHSQPATSHHLAILRHGGIVTPTRSGKNNFYELTDKGRKIAEIVKVMMETA